MTTATLLVETGETAAETPSLATRESEVLSTPLMFAPKLVETASKLALLLSEMTATLTQEMAAVLYVL